MLMLMWIVIDLILGILCIKSCIVNDLTIVQQIILFVSILCFFSIFIRKRKKPCRKLIKKHIAHNHHGVIKHNG